MTRTNTLATNYWPELPYENFKPTAHLLHMAVQMIGKLKLAVPFEPHWANVPLWLTSQGLTSGPIPNGQEMFSVDLNLIDHQIICVTSRGKTQSFKLASMSVAQLYKTFFAALRELEINAEISPMPQEIPHPVAFTQDTVNRVYDKKLAHAWWRIMASSYLVLLRYHSRFLGATPQIGLMWGTFDLRDARYVNTPVPATGINAGYLRRNAMDVAQIEAGWWSGDERYERPAYYSFTYPVPPGIEKAKVKPAAARWDNTLGEFILDYDDVRKSVNPFGDLLAFFESTYTAGTSLAGWSPKLVGPGVPV